FPHSQPASLHSQHRRRIDPKRSHHRRRHGHHRRSENRRRRNRHYREVRQPHLIDQRLDIPHQHHTHRKARYPPARSDPQRPPRHAPHEFAKSRANRYADRDPPPPLYHRIVEHAIQPHRRQQSRQPREERSQHG